MSQPLNRNCILPRLGEVDEEAGEFWTESVFMMPGQRRNLSAFERNRLYLNTAGEGFLDASFASGVDLDSDSRSVVAADFDRDGAADLLVGSVGGGPLRLFLNDLPSISNSVAIDFVGVTSNRSGIGTRVIAYCSSQQFVRDVFPANGFMGIAPAEVLLGVGDAQEIERLEVRWPTGQEQFFEHVPVNCLVTITEGNEQFETAWR